MEKSNIYNIFPIPVYMTKMDRGFTKQELNFVKEQKKHCSKNAGNINRSWKNTINYRFSHN